MLYFTNRAVLEKSKTEKAFTNKFSIMDDRLACADVAGQLDAWRLNNIVDGVNDNDALSRLSAVFNAGKPVLVFIHGNNTSPSRAFYRGLQLETNYDVNVVAFSWPSEGYQPDGQDLSGIDTTRLETDEDDDSLKDVKKEGGKDNTKEGWIERKMRRYRQAKNNAQDSSFALARFLRLVAMTRLSNPGHRYTIAAHSLGCHFFQHTLNLDGVHASVSTASNIVLLAACVRNEQHSAWVQKLSPEHLVYITFFAGDAVLAAASIVDHDTKLGTQPGDHIVRSEKVRYIDFTGAISGAAGHRYFVWESPKKVKKRALALLNKLFTSDIDFPPGGNPKTIYPVGCSHDRCVCYMGGNTAVADGGFDFINT